MFGVAVVALYCYIDSAVREKEGAPWYVPLAYACTAGLFSVLWWAMKQKDSGKGK